MKTAKALAIILGISFAGELLNTLLPLPIPAGVYGLFLMLILLCSQALRLDAVEECGNFLLDNMSPMFIPAGVGIIRYKEQLIEVGIPYLAINIISTIIVFIITGWTAQGMMRWGTKKQERQ